VVRAISSIAHYDYVFDWVFGPSGEIEIRIGATGIDAVKALAGNENVPEGNRVTSDLIAVLHDHFFSLRLDLDIDGTRNTLVREHFEVNQERDNTLDRSYWRLNPTDILNEGPMTDEVPGIWRIVSEAKGPFDDVTGYQLVPEGTVSLLHPDDSPQRRSAFSSAPLWLTRNTPNERAASGDYPNQHPGGAGLPAFANGEPTKGTDIVLWPTIGFRHVTRVEDWPALSTVWKSVSLRPYGFFASNPSIPEE
jgi:primary-amine oxidase